MATNQPKKKTNENKEVTTKSEKAEVSDSSTGKTVAITILATVLGCLVIVIAVLLATGVVKFGGDTDDDDGDKTSLIKSNGDTKKKTDGKPGDLIDNPYPEVTVSDATLAEVGDLKFYLPDDFKSGGKNKDGAYTYNLVDDDGWAQVVVYNEKSSLTPAKYLNKVSSYLDITDTNYQINGTTWTQAENANSLAYATKLDDKIYAVVYNVKLDSDDTSEAMQMIPKTLYMKKIVQD